MFSTLWPLTRELAICIRRHFPDATMVLGGEHGTAVPELVLRSSPIDIVVLGEGEEAFVRLIKSIMAGEPLREEPGLAYRVDGVVYNGGLGARTRKVDDVPLPDWDSFPLEEYI